MSAPQNLKIKSKTASATGRGLDDSDPSRVSPTSRAQPTLPAPCADHEGETRLNAPRGHDSRDNLPHLAPAISGAKNGGTTAEVNDYDVQQAVFVDSSSDESSIRSVSDSNIAGTGSGLVTSQDVASAAQGRLRVDLRDTTGPTHVSYEGDSDESLSHDRAVRRKIIASINGMGGQQLDLILNYVERKGAQEENSTDNTFHAIYDSDETSTDDANRAAFMSAMPNCDQVKGIFEAMDPYTQRKVTGDLLLALQKIARGYCVVTDSTAHNGLTKITYMVHDALKEVYDNIVSNKYDPTRSGYWSNFCRRVAAVSCHYMWTYLDVLLLLGDVSIGFMRLINCSVLAYESSGVALIGCAVSVCALLYYLYGDFYKQDDRLTFIAQDPRFTTYAAYLDMFWAGQTGGQTLFPALWTMIRSAQATTHSTHWTWLLYCADQLLTFITGIRQVQRDSHCKKA